ncbi:MAG: hypothetical protein ACK5NT_15795 [Pyrinomonadaceae bacterium]
MITIDRVLEQINNVIAFPFTEISNDEPNFCEEAAILPNRSKDIADLIDSRWNLSIKDVSFTDNLVAVTVSLSFSGITREAIGTAILTDRFAVKSAEHDAIDNAVKRFNLGALLQANECNTSPKQFDMFPENPFASSLGDMISSTQLTLIRRLGRELLLKVDLECRACMNCDVDELSVNAASAFIEHLKNLRSTNRAALRKAI